MWKLQLFEYSYEAFKLSRNQESIFQNGEPVPEFDFRVQTVPDECCAPAVLERTFGSLLTPEDHGSQRALRAIFGYHRLARERPSDLDQDPGKGILNSCLIISKGLLALQLGFDLKNTHYISARVVWGAPSYPGILLILLFVGWISFVLQCSCRCDLKYMLQKSWQCANQLQILLQTWAYNITSWWYSSCTWH